MAQRMRERLTRVPGDWQAWATLGMAQVQLARVTADPAHYDLAQTAFDQSLRTEPDNSAALTGQAALAAARHDFTGALDRAIRATTADPYSADAQGVLADALIELGRYDDGFAAVQRMVDLRPDTGSLGRVFYTYELRGDIPHARELMERALEAATGPSETVFALQHQAELAATYGDLDTATATVELGLAQFPGHPPLLAQRARVEAMRGNIDAAITDWRSVVEKLPLPGYLMALADLLDTQGRTSEAATLLQVAEANRKIVAASGAAGDIDLILFEAERGDPTQAVTDARTLYTQRPSQGVADALAWALHQAGQDTEALSYADTALHLGSRDPNYHFHRGIIRAALNQRDGAIDDLKSALATNPAFSVAYAPVARQTLTRLGGAA